MNAKSAPLTGCEWAAEENPVILISGKGGYADRPCRACTGLY